MSRKRHKPEELVAKLRQRRHGGGALGAAVRAGEQPRPSTEGKASQRSLGGIVRETSAPVIEEGPEAVEALQQVVDGLGNRRRARQRQALLAEPGLEFVDERPAPLTAHLSTLLDACAVDLALDRKESVDAPDRLQRDGRDGRGVLPAPRLGGDVGEIEEAAPRVRPGVDATSR